MAYFEKDYYYTLGLTQGNLVDCYTYALAHEMHLEESDCIQVEWNLDEGPKVVGVVEKMC